MDHPIRADNYEIIQQPPAAIERLSANSCAGGFKICSLDVWNKLLQGMCEGLFAQRTIVFPDAAAPIFHGHPPETGKDRSLDCIPQVEICFAIAFALQRQHRVWTRFDPIVDAPGEVNSKEGEAGIGHRINQIANEMAPGGN